MAKKLTNDIERFYNSYTSNKNGCWIWNKSLNKGYGRFYIGSRTDHSRKPVVASRWIFEYLNGKIPAGILVCHTCDNPSCVNPEHLFLGTIKDNADDMVKKLRAPDGITKRDGTMRITHSGNSHSKRIKSLNMTIPTHESISSPHVSLLNGKETVCVTVVCPSCNGKKEYKLSGFLAWHKRCKNFTGKCRNCFVSHV